jgi:hypothetical protein
MEEDMNQFKKSVKKYLDLYDEEEKLKEQIKTMKEEKDGLENDILHFIESHDFQDRDIVVGQYKMKYTKTKQTESVTKKFTFDRLVSYFQGDEMKAKEVLDFIYNERNSTIKTSLKLNHIQPS